jgi:hypothetical protein
VAQRRLGSTARRNGTVGRKLAPCLQRGRRRRIELCHRRRSERRVGPRRSRTVPLDPSFRIGDRDAIARPSSMPFASNALAIAIAFVRTGGATGGGLNSS